MSSFILLPPGFLLLHVFPAALHELQGVVALLLVSGVWGGSGTRQLVIRPAAADPRKHQGAGRSGRYLLGAVVTEDLPDVLGDFLLLVVPVVDMFLP